MVKLCFIGNSHIDQFNIKGLPNIDVIYKRGASIKGLTNPNSTLGLSNDIELYCKTNPEAILVFFLGQVDIEFGYYYKCVKDKNKYSISEYINDLIMRYNAYLKNITNKFCVLSINPCVITDIHHIYKVCFSEDDGKSGEYSSNDPKILFDFAKEYITETFEERKRFNMLFNQNLRVMCQVNNFKYIDLWKYLCTNDELHDKYTPITIDHHLQKVNDLGLYKYLLTQLFDIL